MERMVVMTDSSLHDRILDLTYKLEQCRLAHRHTREVLHAALLTALEIGERRAAEIEALQRSIQNCPGPCTVPEREKGN